MAFMSQQKSADVIIIGGGVAGLSTAMQLAGRGASVLVLERERLGNGSTGRAAGLLGQLRGNAEHTRMLIDGVAIEGAGRARRRRDLCPNRLAADCGDARARGRNRRASGNGQVDRL